MNLEQLVPTYDFIPYWTNDCEPVVMQDLIGKVFTSIKYNQDQEQLIFYTEDEAFVMLHYQDCCETVYLADITGDISDLIGTPILKAEEVEGYTADALSKYEDSYTWTYYKLATAKGYVDIRWYGSSNGYYSEGVSLEKINLDLLKKA